MVTLTVLNSLFHDCYFIIKVYLQNLNASSNWILSMLFCILQKVVLLTFFKIRNAEKNIKNNDVALLVKIGIGERVIIFSFN